MESGGWGVEGVTRQETPSLTYIITDMRIEEHQQCLKYSKVIKSVYSYQSEQGRADQLVCSEE